MSEHTEQKMLFQWARLASQYYPDLKLMFAIPNAQVALTTTREKNKKFALVNYMKSEGVRKGIPDIMLPVARKGCHGLFIELKTMDGRVSDEQKTWINELREQGYKAELCRGLDAAREVIINYLS